ncbi:iron-hydroxamate ABC transporter substrate-binding protein [Halalkalibacter sp. APA_J-10(15)]|uniref:iron-hydroxamate ABC transporter substrate-binding protein n=1 Tax=unclassified Halalkalibacter TaxID=2893063 RepID=UPI001FF6911A|nr:iron-hydroxamate ABC transporter substrate-binding protein [Halalkalibacter sp. APA_J-10(15)]MCK0472269.1 iron-hydroxamate ABC transporter substrate-binding protein [Halalkalibacter sp. APA_J-10(15)]
MKKLLISLLLIFILVLSACGSDESTDVSNSKESDPEADAEMITYESELGPVEVPANPQRIVALTNGPNVLALDGNIVGIDEWTEANPLFTERLKGVEIVSDATLEKIQELNPDLIIAGSWQENLDSLSKIAPTVVYTWGALDYLSQQLDIGKLLNKEEEAAAWIEDFQNRAQSTGDEVRALIGEDATVSVFENGNDELYVFGDDYARGTEILYQEMKLNMPEQVEEMALESGVYTLSLEAVPEFAGDYIVLSKNPDADDSMFELNTWQNVPAVQNDQVIEINSKASTYSDPITLEYLLDIFEGYFLD